MVVIDGDIGGCHKVVFITGNVDDWAGITSVVGRIVDILGVADHALLGGEIKDDERFRAVDAGNSIIEWGLSCAVGDFRISSRRLSQIRLGGVKIGIGGSCRRQIFVDIVVIGCTIGRIDANFGIETELIRAGNTVDSIVVRGRFWALFIDSTGLILLQDCQSLGKHAFNSLATHPSCARQFSQVGILENLALLGVLIENLSLKAIHALPCRDVKVAGYRTVDALIIGIEIRLLRRTRSSSYRHFREGPIFGGVVGRHNIREVRVEDILDTLFLRIVHMLVLGASGTLLLGNIENGSRILAHNALLAIEERLVDVAVGNIVVADRALVVLFDQVVNGHVA